MFILQYSANMYTFYCFIIRIRPHGFTRIRHYGFLSSASKSKSLALIRASLKVQPPVQQEKENPWQEIVFNRMDIKPGVCKCCGGEMVVIQTMPNRFRASQPAPPYFSAHSNVYKTAD